MRLRGLLGRGRALERLVAGPARRIGPVVVFPVCRLRIAPVAVENGGWVHGERSPVALVVRRHGRLSTLCVGGEAWCLDELLERTEGLRERLEEGAG